MNWVFTANSIPAALCYQRLRCNDDGTAFYLHGLNAIHLPDVGWYRVDARGNRADVDAQFTPPRERLAFPLNLTGEADIPGLFADPLPVVVAALKSHSTADELCQHLPDLGAYLRLASALTFREVTSSDIDQLAERNHQLIRDEGHRNRMTVPQVAERMRGLAGAGLPRHGF